MKNAAAFILAVIMILSAAGCDRPPIDLSSLTGAFDLSPILDTDDYPDKLYSYNESDAELVIFRAGDLYLTYSRDKNYWVRLIGDVPDRMMLGDGRFELISADIKRYSGGIAGFMGNPEIVKLNAYEPMTLEQAVTFCGLKDYAPELIRSGEPLICGDYLFCVNRVYHDGALVGEFATQIEAEAAMGLREIPDTSVEMERIGDYRLYVFRCGDKYLANCPRIGMNPCWTPYINSDFGNEPENFTLEDGEAAYIMHADIIKLNGGEAGYVNTPMITQTGGIEIVGYDILSDHMPPFWGEHKSVGEGDTVADWIERADFSENGNAMFERYNGTWLIFFIDGKYYVYLDDYTNKQQIAVCESESEVEKVLKEHRQNGGSL